MLNPFLLFSGVLWYNSFSTTEYHNEEKWIIQTHTSIQTLQKNTHDLSTVLNCMACRQHRVHATFSHTLKKERSLAARDIPQHHTYSYSDAGGLNIGKYHNGPTTVLRLTQCSTNTHTNIQERTIPSSAWYTATPHVQLKRRRWAEHRQVPQRPNKSFD